MDSERKIHKSQYVPKGNWGHSLSPLTHVGFGSNGFDPNETTHSSYWLWAADNCEAIKPRFSLGFPEEFEAFSLRNESKEILQNVNIDLWVFRDLSGEDFNKIESLLTVQKAWKVIFIKNHTNNYEAFFSHPTIQNAVSTNQAFLSFLPPASTHDSLLTPQQVIWNLESIDPKIPILILDVPITQNSFFNSLNRQIYADELKAQSFLSISTFRFLDKVGLGHLLLFIEAFFGFFLSYRMQRILTAISHLFDLQPWYELAKRCYIFTWHKLVKPLLFNIFFKFIYDSIVFIWYKLFFKPADLFYNLILKNFAIVFWHKIIWPIFSFIRFDILGKIHWLYSATIPPIALLLWHKIISPIYTIFYVSFIKILAACSIFWGKCLLPVVQFVFYKLLYSYPKIIWIFFRHKIIQPIYSFLRFHLGVKLWVLIRYKLVGILVWLSYPLRKIYWIAKHEYEKRIKYRGKYEKP